MISFVNEEASQWHQILWVDTTRLPQLNILGSAQAGSSLRVWVAMMTGELACTLHEVKLREAESHVSLRHERQAKLTRIAEVRSRLYR